MAKCSRCGRRKAKRRCPALGSDLCPLCCGRLREKEIRCPPGCPVLTQHGPYQEKKIIYKKTASHEDIPEDERLIWLSFNIEAALFEYSRRHLSFSDRDAVLALELAKEELEKSQSRLVLPQQKAKPKSEIVEAVLLSIDRCRYEKRIILPQDEECYTREEKRLCLDATILKIKRTANGHLEDRTYLEGLARRWERLQDLSGQKKVITLP